MIDLNLSPEQQAIRNAAASFGTTVLSTARAVYEQKPIQSARFRSTRPLYSKAVELV